MKERIESTGRLVAATSNKYDFLLDVNGGILDIRPTSQGKRWDSEIKKISAKFCG